MIEEEISLSPKLSPLVAFTLPRPRQPGILVNRTGSFVQALD